MKTDDFSPLREVTGDVTETNVNICAVMRRSACCCDIIDDVMGDATEMFRCYGDGGVEPDPYRGHEFPEI